MANKNFTRKNLINHIYKNLGFSKNLSANFIDNFFNTLINELVNLKEIKITSFGTFQTRNKKERIGRNPKNKITAKIKARRIVKFIASNKLKEKINTK